jgi:hypothetical protein
MTSDAEERDARLSLITTKTLPDDPIDAPPGPPTDYEPSAEPSEDEEAPVDDIADPWDIEDEEGE